jgi:membrane protein DedA with SNARE-associated domain
VIEWILAQPFVFAAALLALVACFRSQGTYWLGRGIRAGVIRAKWAQRFQEEKATAAVARLEKYGWPAIPLSFLTVGFQTAVHLSAGLIGWRWPRYTLAASIGWVLWGVVYAAGGLAVFAGLFALAQASPMAAVGVIKLVIIAVLALTLWRSAPLRDRLTKSLN